MPFQNAGEIVWVRLADRSVAGAVMSQAASVSRAQSGAAKQNVFPPAVCGRGSPKSAAITARSGSADGNNKIPERGSREMASSPARARRSVHRKPAQNMRHTFAAVLKTIPPF
jgi:hypothetical protein